MKITINAVRSAATRYDAKVQPSDFDAWHKSEHDAAWNDGYAASLASPPSQAGLLLDTLSLLPRLNSAALRKIADECERMIRERMEDGVFD